MKILATITVLLVLAVGCLGYVAYWQHQDTKTLEAEVSALHQEMDIHHQVLLSHKKAILGLRSDQKQSDKAVFAILMYLKSQESDPSPKTEQNTYVSGN